MINRLDRGLKGAIRPARSRFRTAPSLTASAHVGIVLQEVGSQATVDASSAVLQADIGQLPAAIVLARRTMRLIWVNVVIALSMNLGVIVAAATVGIPLWLSVAMDNLGLMVVLANSVWPLFWKVAPVKAEDAPNVLAMNTV